MKPYSDAGKIDRARTYVAMQARLRIVVRVPERLAEPGAELPGDFEPDLRAAVAHQIVGLTKDGLTVDYVAVEQFADSEV